MPYPVFGEHAESATDIAYHRIRSNKSDILMVHSTKPIRKCLAGKTIAFETSGTMRNSTLVLEYENSSHQKERAALQNTNLSCILW